MDDWVYVLKRSARLLCCDQMVGGQEWKQVDSGLCDRPTDETMEAAVQWEKRRVTHIF